MRALRVAWRDLAHRRSATVRICTTGALLFTLLFAGACTGTVTLERRNTDSRSGDSRSADLTRPITLEPRLADRIGFAFAFAFAVRETGTEQHAGATRTQAPDHFQIIMGRGPVMTPPPILGRLAGTQIDEFAFDLLRRLGASGNLCVSPTSIARLWSWSAAAPGARPRPRWITSCAASEILQRAAEIAALLAAFSNQTFYDDSDPGADPSATPDPAQTPAAESVSQQVFAQKGMTLAQAYLDALSTSFGAGVGVLDFAKDPEAARADHQPLGEPAHAGSNSGGPAAGRHNLSDAHRLGQCDLSESRLG